jgi:sn-glycerol 3-phosphate transport system ATP-binding protein
MGDQVVLMNQGRIEQSASPRAIYAQPASTFAARFIGTPPMNLLNCVDGRVDGSDQRVDTFTGARTLGIRPEHIAVASEGVAATVEQIEYLGADQIVRCQIGSQFASVRVPPEMPLTLGQSVQLQFAPDGVRHYDAQTHQLIP